jgi:SAM-dependent methyltransferase
MRTKATREDIIQYWTGPKAAERSYPAHRGRWPDHDHIHILRRLCAGKVCDVGCGTGRCADAFEPFFYIGVDINEAAIERARREKPEHVFQLIAWGDKYPAGDTYLFHTSLMHVLDEELGDVLARVWGRIVIFECMQREYRDERHFIFNRTPEEYMTALREVGFEILGLEEYPTAYQVDRQPPLVRRFLVARR